VSKFALVALLPEPKDDATRADFVSREFDTPAQIGAAIAELEEKVPGWRVLTICHVEDLPLLMEPPEGMR
jgi:hypothetical protein